MYRVSFFLPLWILRQLQFSEKEDKFACSKKLKYCWFAPAMLRAGTDFASPSHRTLGVAL